MTALSFTVIRFLINIRVLELPHKHNGFVEEVGPRLKSNYPFLSLLAPLYIKGKGVAEPKRRQFRECEQKAKTLDKMCWLD